MFGTKEKLGRLLLLVALSTPLTIVLLRFRSRFLSYYQTYSHGVLGPKYSSKLSESLFFMVQYGVLFTVSTLCLIRNGHWNNRSKMYEQIPNPFNAWELVCYIIETAVYVSSSIGLLADQERRKYSDAFRLMVHHVLTLSLIWVSWAAGWTSVGVLVMWIHDMSDIYIEGAKCTKYVIGVNAAAPAFGLILAVFLYSRGFYFTKEVLLTMALVFPEVNVSEGGILTGEGKFCLMCLCGLEILNILWIGTLVKMLVLVLVRGMRDDIRDPDTAKAKTQAARRTVSLVEAEVN